MAAASAAPDATPPLDEAAASPPLAWEEDAPEGGAGADRKRRRKEKEGRDRAKKPRRSSSGGKGGKEGGSKDGGIIPGIDGGAKKKKAPSKFLVDLRYHAALPALPTPAKFLRFPHAADRLYRYQAAPMEAGRRHALLEEPMGGIDLNMVEDGVWRGSGAGGALPEDEPLLGASGVDRRRARPVNPGVTWIRRSTYLPDTISVSAGTPGFKMQTVAAAAAEAAASGRHHLAADDDGADKPAARTAEEERLEEIEAIEETFRLARRAPKHPTKPGMRAVSVEPLLPDASLALESLAMVRFDTAPDAEVRRDAPEEAEARAMLLRSLLMERVPAMSKAKSVSHALYARRPDPAADAAADSGAAGPSSPPAVPYHWVREYDLRPTPTTNLSDNYFFVTREDGTVRFGRFDHRMFLNKKALDPRDADNAAMELLVGDADTTTATALPRKQAAAEASPEEDAAA